MDEFDAVQEMRGRMAALKTKLGAAMLASAMFTAALHDERQDQADGF